MKPRWTACSERFARVDTSWLAKIRSRSDLATYLAICSRADGNTRAAWPSKATIAKDAGIAPEDVRRSLRELEKIGAIKTNTRFLSGTSEQTSSRYVLQESVTDRFAFIAAPWIARIETFNALRLFVALCSCAEHDNSFVRGYSRSEIARIAGFHESAVTKAMPLLITIGAISATISTTGSKTTYTVKYPPEAWAADENLENRKRRIERFNELVAHVAECRRDGTTFHFAAERGIPNLWFSGSMAQARPYTVQPYIVDLPWCMFYAAIGSSDGAPKALKKAA